MNDTFHTPSDFKDNPVTIPAGYLIKILDAHGNLIAHRDVSRQLDQTDSNEHYANQFADENFYTYPLTVVIYPDPNAVPLTTPSSTF